MAPGPTALRLAARPAPRRSRRPRRSRAGAAALRAPVLPTSGAQRRPSRRGAGSRRRWPSRSRSGLSGGGRPGTPGRRPSRPAPRDGAAGRSPRSPPGSTWPLRSRTRGRSARARSRSGGAARRTASMTGMLVMSWALVLTSRCAFAAEVTASGLSTALTWSVCWSRISAVARYCIGARRLTATAPHSVSTKIAAAVPERRLSALRAAPRSCAGVRSSAVAGGAGTLIASSLPGASARRGACGAAAARRATPTSWSRRCSRASPSPRTGCSCGRAPARGR